MRHRKKVDFEKRPYVPFNDLCGHEPLNKKNSIRVNFHKNRFINECAWKNFS